MRRLTGILHDAHRGLSWITTQDANQSAVGAETIGVEIREENSRSGYRIKIDRHIGQSAHFLH